MEVAAVGMEVAAVEVELAAVAVSVLVAQVVSSVLAKCRLAMVSVAVAARMATKVEATALRRAAGKCSPEATERWWESCLPFVSSWL